MAHGVFREIEALVARLSQPQPGTSALHFESEHAQGLVSALLLFLSTLAKLLPCPVTVSGLILVASRCPETTPGLCLAGG